MKQYHVEHIHVSKDPIRLANPYSRVVEVLETKSHGVSDVKFKLKVLVETEVPDTTAP
jgi:hypothetical protein